MEISSVSSLLSMQQDLAASTSKETTGEDFKNALNAAIENQDDTALKESCNELEAYMLSMVFKQMKQSMLSDDDEDALIPKGDYTKTFEDTMINEVAKQMVEAGGIGLSDTIYKQIKSSYGVQMQMSAGNEET